MTWTDVYQSLLDALETGLPYGVGFIGVWLMFRVMRDFDLTVDGTFATGAAVAAIWITHGHSAWLALVLAFAAGAVGGLLTYSIHRLLSMPVVLTSIIVGVGLFSVNLKVMGTPNLNLVGTSTVTERWTHALGAEPSDQLAIIALFALVVLVVSLVLMLFLMSQTGLGMRASGINPAMARAQGVATGAALCIALCLGNGLTGLSGALVAQDQGFADVSMGIGTILFGVTAVLLGEVVIRRRTPFWGLAAVLLGTIAYRFLLALALRAGIDPDLYQSLTAVIVIAAVGASVLARRVDGSRRARLAVRRQGRRAPEPEARHGT